MQKRNGDMAQSYYQMLCDNCIFPPEHRFQVNEISKKSLSKVTILAIWSVFIQFEQTWSRLSEIARHGRLSVRFVKISEFNYSPLDYICTGSMH